MSNFEEMKLLISEMSGTGENVLAVSKSYIEFMGSLEGGVLLSQMIFFSDKSSRKDGYFWKTYDDWKEHTHLTEYSIRKHVGAMKQMGFLETKVFKAQGNPTVHYKVDMDLFISNFISFLSKQRIVPSNSKVRNIENEVSLTEITTETTKHKKNMPSDKSESKSLVEQQFEEWWIIYAKKVGKPKAFTAFKRVVKQYDFETLKANTDFYVKNHVKDKQYQPHPTTFLNSYHPDDERFCLTLNQPYNNNNTNQQQSSMQYIPVQNNLYGDVGE